MQYQTELLFGDFLQTYMSLANSISPTSLTKVYLALNSLFARPTGHWDFASSADPGQVNLTILLAAAFSADLSLPDFQPIAHVMAAHVAILKCCSSIL